MRWSYNRVETTTITMQPLSTPQDLYAGQFWSLCHTYRSKWNKIFYLPSFPDSLKAIWAKTFFLEQRHQSRPQTNFGTTSFTESRKLHCSLIIQMKYVNKNKIFIFLRMIDLNLSHNNYKEFQAYFWRHFMQQGLLNQRILIRSHNT